MKSNTFVITARDSSNRLIKRTIQASNSSQARELFESMYSNIKIQSVILEQYSIK